MISGELRGDQQVAEYFEALPALVHAALLRKVTSLTTALRRHVVEDKLSGQVLKRRTGNLARSIQQDVTDGTASIVGRVYSSGDVKYAGIHEYGGNIKHPGGTAYIILKSGLAQFVSNKAATAEMMRTKPHDIPMPERSFMRSSLADMRTQIVDGLKQTVADALAAKGST